MFCQYCGSQLRNDAAFCSGCGKRVSSPSVTRGVTSVRELYRSLALSPLFIVAIAFFSVSAILTIISSISSYEDIFYSIDLISMFNADIGAIKFFIILFFIIPDTLIPLIVAYGMWDIFASVSGRNHDIKTTGFTCIQVFLYIQFIRAILGLGIVMIAVVGLSSMLARLSAAIDTDLSATSSLLVIILVLVICAVLIGEYYYIAIKTVTHIKSSVKEDVVSSQIPVALAVFGIISALITLALGIYAEVENADTMFFISSLFSFVTSFTFSMFIFRYNAEISNAKIQSKEQQRTNEYIYI